MLINELMEVKEPKVTLVQDTPGSWTHIAVLVNGVKKFHAAKFGSGFWSIAAVDGNKDTIGTGGSKAEIKAVVMKYLKKS